MIFVLLIPNAVTHLLLYVLAIAVGTVVTAGVLALWIHKQLQATEIGHTALHGAFDKLDLLKFENHKDSIEEPGATPPAELVQMFMQYLSGTPLGSAM